MYSGATPYRRADLAPLLPPLDSRERRHPTLRPQTDSLLLFSQPTLRSQSLLYKTRPSPRRHLRFRWRHPRLSPPRQAKLLPLWPLLPAMDHLPLLANFRLQRKTLRLCSRRRTLLRSLMGSVRTVVRLRGALRMDSSASSNSPHLPTTRVGNRTSCRKSAFLDPLCRVHKAQRMTWVTRGRIGLRPCLVFQ